MKAIMMVFAILGPMSASAQTVDEAVKHLASTLGEQLGKAETKRLALAAFSELNGNETALGDFIAEELTTALFGVGDFVIVERREYNRVIDEHKLYGSGGFSADNVPEIGKQLGVDAIITGSITALDKQIRINARAISVESTRVFGAASATANRNADVEALMKRRSMAENVATLSVPGTVPQPNDVQFENRFLRVTPVSVILSESDSAITVTTEFMNLTETPVYLGYEFRGEPLSAITKHGETLVPYFKGGHVVGLVRARGAGTGSLYTEIGPGKRLSVVWRFRNPSGAAIIGDELSMQVKLHLYTRADTKNYERVQVAFDRISLR